MGVDERTAKKIWYLAQEIALLADMDIDAAVTCAWWEIVKRLDYVRASLKGTIPEETVKVIYDKVAAKLMERHGTDIIHMKKNTRCPAKRILAHVLVNEYAVPPLCVARTTKYSHSSLYTYDIYEVIHSPKVTSFEAEIKWWYIQIKQYIEEAIGEVRDELSTAEDICRAAGDV